MSHAIHDFRTAALSKEKNVMLNSMNADGTIDVVLAGVLPSKKDNVLLTLSQDGVDTDTSWSVESVKPSENGQAVCHAILKFNKNI